MDFCSRWMGCLVTAAALGLSVSGAARLNGAEDDPRRPPAIEVVGVPKIPDALVERLTQYDNLRTASFSGWSPDGKGMLVRTQFGNTEQLHRVYEPGGRREQVTFFNEPVEGGFVRNANDGAMLLTLSRGGDENTQIYSLNPNQYSSALLTDGKSRNLLGPVQKDGKKFAFGTNRRNGRDTDWFLADCRKPSEPQLLLEVDNEVWYANGWSPDGTQLLMIRFRSATESYPAVLDVATRKLTPLPYPKSDSAKKPSDSSDQSSYRLLRFSADGKSIYLTTDIRGEFMELAQLDPKTGEYKWLSADIPWDVSDLEIDDKTGNVAFAANENGQSSLYLIQDGKRRELQIPLGTIDSLDFSPDGKQLGLTLSRANLPPDAYSIELASGKLVRWTFSEIGGLNPDIFVEPKAIEFPSFDGRNIPAWMYSPRGVSKDKPTAVLIVIHGGPEGQYQPVFAGNIQFYVTELGLTVICPNVRGSEGYGKTYLKLDNAEKREDSVKDIGALLDWIATQPQLDAKRVAVAGGSYGGFMVLSSLTHFGTRLRAGIDEVGIANFITFLERTSAYRQDLRRIEYGDERDPKMRKLFEQINPTANADKIKANLMVVHGKNDPRVPFFEGEQIAEKVKSQGRTVWTVYADNEGHGFRKRENRNYLRAAMTMFLQQQLELQ